MESVNARIRYLSPDWRGRRERPRISTREQRRSNTRFYDVEIEDARPLLQRGELSLEGCGFVLLPHASEVRNFRDDAEIARVYYPEIRKLLLELTGAQHTPILQHVIRREDATAFNAAYARYVHCDYSESQADSFARQLMVQAGICSARKTSRYDYAWYNTWQPIERPVESNPLTVIDTRTLERGDFVDYAFLESGDDNLASAPLHSEQHRHYYFPHMQTDELLVFKQLDSRDELGSPCAHTSFDDPRTAEDAPRRRSIEVRVMCVFERKRPGR